LAVSKFKSLINRIFFSLFLLIIYFINLLLKCIINFAWVLTTCLIRKVTEEGYNIFCKNSTGIGSES
jgi:hypothetical protein